MWEFKEDEETRYWIVTNGKQAFEVLDIYQAIALSALLNGFEPWRD